MSDVADLDPYLVFDLDFCAGCGDPIMRRTDRPGCWMHRNVTSAVTCPLNLPAPGGDHPARPMTAGQVIAALQRVPASTPVLIYNAADGTEHAATTVSATTAAATISGGPS